MKSNLCTNDLIVLHPLEIPFAGIELTSQRVRGLRGTSELPGRPAMVINISVQHNGGLLPDITGTVDPM